MPLAVIREGVVKTHVILRGYLAEDLLSDDPHISQNAVHLIVYTLASVSLTDLVNEKFPGHLLQNYPQTYETLISRFTEGIFSTYFCTRASSWNAEQLEFYRNDALSSLQNMVSGCTEARVAYAGHRNYETLYSECAALVAECLRSFARYYATKAPLYGPHQPNRMLDKCLDFYELRNWAELFSADLHNFYEHIEDWAQLEELHFLNRHFERLIAVFGVLPDQLVDGSLYIHVFGDSFIESLAAKG
jgi:hypothetical protein